MLSRLKERAAVRRTSRDLYGSIVAQARSEAFYRVWGIPDTMEGRLEMIILHVALVLDRLGREGPAGQALGQALSEAYIADVDDALRQIGIGDMGVPRRVKKAAAALRERHMTYAGALAARDRQALAKAVQGFIHADDVDAGPNSDACAGIADYIMQAADTLAATPAAAALAGAVAFPVPAGR